MKKTKRTLAAIAAMATLTVAVSSAYAVDESNTTTATEETSKITEDIYSQINAGAENIKVHISYKGIDIFEITNEATKLADEYEKTLSDDEYTAVEKQKLKNKYAYEKKTELAEAAREKNIENVIKSLGDTDVSICDEHDLCLVGTLTPEQIKATEDNKLITKVSIEPFKIHPNTLEQLVSENGTFLNNELIYSDKYKFAVENLPAKPENGSPERDVLVVYDIPYEDTTGMSQGEWQKHISINHNDYVYFEELWLMGGDDRRMYSGVRYRDVVSKNSSFKLDKPLEIVFVVNGERPNPDYDKTEEQINKIWGFDIFKYVNFNKNGEDTDTKKNISTETTEKEISTSKVEALLRGDADVNNEVNLADITTVAKYNLSNSSYPLANEIAYANADMNGNGKVDGLDTSALIENQLGKKGKE